MSDTAIGFIWIVNFVLWAYSTSGIVSKSDKPTKFLCYLLSLFAGIIAVLVFVTGTSTLTAILSIVFVVILIPEMIFFFRAAKRIKESFRQTIEDLERKTERIKKSS